ncbi:MAG: PmoA family protein [Verrucomicrobia bacterium]|nr:PmoA family protein [Verrucomicrobiota bacterium]
MTLKLSSTFFLLFAPWVITSTAATAPCTINDADGALGQTAAPVASQGKFKKSQLAAARSGRLALAETVGKTTSKTLVPVQCELAAPGSEPCVVWVMSSGAAGQRQFEWRESKVPFAPVMQATRDPASGQFLLAENGKPVLRYNYQTVEPGDVLDKVTPGNRIYARPRSDYIHPLYGLSGEELTRDWSLDHPHHRGIYWAWPEVDFGKERGDLHALQKVFARPTGNVRLESGPVFAQIEAENLWLWEDRDPIVREQAIIRAYHATPQGRVVDLVFRFVALKDGVTLARRGTEHYGGLNVRMATPASQVISVHTDSSNAVPRRAWSDLSGIFSGAGAASGLTVLQYPRNPDYPGDWQQYPDLAWCQPTFPASGTRYPLLQSQPLVLRFRLFIHAGAKPDDDLAAKLWDAFQASAAPAPTFGTSGAVK